MPASETVRVVMLWPKELKAEIQAEVGRRGLTAYVLEAVRNHRQPKQEISAPVVQTLVCSTCSSEIADPSEGCWVCDP